jgi:hypothetical protein
MDMFHKWFKGDKSGIHPDLRIPVFAIALKNGGKEEVSLILCVLTYSGKQFTNLQLIRLLPLTRGTQHFVILDKAKIPN